MAGKHPSMTGDSRVEFISSKRASIGSRGLCELAVRWSLRPARKPFSASISSLVAESFEPNAGECVPLRRREPHPRIGYRVHSRGPPRVTADLVQT